MTEVIILANCKQETDNLEKHFWTSAAICDECVHKSVMKTVQLENTGQE